MAYELTALIGVGAAPPGTVALPQRAWLLALCDDDAHRAAELSRESPVAYITAQFFGGAGGQAAPSTGTAAKKHNSKPAIKPSTPLSTHSA